jgi:hypothetical protein
MSEAGNVDSGPETTCSSVNDLVESTSKIRRKYLRSVLVEGGGIVLCLVG